MCLNNQIQNYIDQDQVTNNLILDNQHNINHHPHINKLIL